MKITAPNYTQTPNDLFDHWLPLLKESELKVLLVIMRKTFGWHKVRDRISIRQLATLTGLAQETVIIATKSLQKKGVILKHVIGKPGLQETYYELVVSEDSNNSYPSEKQRGKDDRPLGFTPLGESEPQKKPSSSKEKTTTKERQSAAVSSEKEQSKEQDFIYADLKPIDIPKKDKIEISTRYDGETVRKAIAWATSPQTTLTKGLAPAIKWACVNKPEIPQPKHVEKAKVDVTPFNRSYYRELLKIANLHSIGLRESTTEYLETENAKIYYKDRSFLEQIENFLRKKGVVDERILSTIKLCQKDLVKQVC
jgi:phage replication O-like protein O